MNRISAFIVSACFLVVTTLAIYLSFNVGSSEFLPAIDADFQIGFLASLWEDILFFLVVTVGISIAQHLNKTPDSLKAKMQALFGSSIKYTNNLHSNLEHKLSDMLAYFEKISIQMEILSVSDDKNVIEVQYVRRIVVGNLSKDKSATHALQINLEPKNFFEGKPPIVFDIESAEIDNASIVDPDTREVIFHQREFSQAVKEVGPTFSIGVNKFRWYKYSMKSWEDLSKGKALFDFVARKYIKDTEIQIRNCSNSDFTLRASTSIGETELVLKRQSDKSFRPNINDNAGDALIKIEVVSIG